MDAGVVDTFESDVYPYKLTATAPQLKGQESHDDGYETSNSGETGQRKLPGKSPDPLPPPPDPTDGPHVDKGPGEEAAEVAPEPNMTEEKTADMEKTEEGSSEPCETKTDNSESDKVEDNKLVDMETDTETRLGPSPLSQSPKQASDLIPEDSRSNLSPSASNSQSESSVATLRSNNNQSFDNPENLNLRQEDSLSQENQYHQQPNPYDMSQFNQNRPQDHFNFGSIKREPYDLNPAEHDPYAQYKRDDPYNDPYARYGPNSYPYPNRNPYPNQQMSEMMMYNGIKRETEDPYSFVDDEAAMCAMLGQQHGQNLSMPPGLGHGALQADPSMMMMQNQQVLMGAPKKRGRKKKLKDENGMEIKQEPGMDLMTPVPKPVKERKKHDRFNGMSEEEVSRRTLPDHLAENLDIIIIGINPGLFAAYKGHHYAGPGNHFWKCLYLSGLTREQMSADEDYKLLHFGIGFTNMVQRATKGSADLTRREIKEGSAALLEKIQTFRPKIAVFNGKLIYEVFSGKKDFCFGKQSDTVHGTNTYMWVMPSSSARCAQLPRAADKVPFYAALKKFRDYLNGAVHHVDESELIFPDTTCRRPQEETEARRLTMGPDTPCDTMILEDGTEVPLKKKRGRPKKIKLENGEVVPPAPRAPRAPRNSQQSADCLNGEQPAKKKRGRPKKIRPEEQQFLLQQQQQQQQIAPPQNPLPSMPGMNATTETYNQMHQAQDFPTQPIQSMFQSNQTVIPNQQSNPRPTTSPYFQHSADIGSSSAMPEQPSDLSLPSVPIGPPSTSNMNRSQPTYGQSPAPYSQSPRPQNLGYNQSPRSQGYSQSPQRHQTMTPSYSNSPVPPANNSQSASIAYPQSPANPNSQNPQFRQTSPQRPHSQNNYSSPASGHQYSRSPVPQSYSQQPQQSPMYAQSPANSTQQNQGYTRTSPAPQTISGYTSHSPGHPYSQSPVPQNLSGPPYSQSPAPQNLQNPTYSQSPAPPSQPISYSQRSPVPQGGQQSYSQSPVPQGSQPQSYQSPSRSSYSQHSSPAQSQRSQSYSNSPVSQTAPQHPAFGSQSRIGTPSYNQNKPSPPDGQNSNSNNNSMGTPQQQYANDLSTEISAAISSPGPVSPGMGHIDFEPPIATSKIRVPETDSNSMTNPASQDNSPMQPGSNSNSSVSDFKQVESQYSNRDDLMGGCDNPLLQMHESPHLPSPVQGQNSNRHSALNLIGPPTTSSMDPLQNTLNLRGTPTPYSNSLYGSALPPSPHEQRLGFQVPQPSNSANSSYGTDLSGGLTSNSPKLQLDASLGLDRLGPNPYGYQEQNSRLQDGGPAAMMASHQLHHTSAMYASQFNRSTPPHHPLGQSSPFSPHSGNGGGAFRGISLQSSQSLDNSGANQGGAGMTHSSGGSPLDYNTPAKPQTQPGQKSQDVASKSLSGLESLVDQIPSIADGSTPENLAPLPPANPTPVTPLADPYAAHPASLYNPYYQTSAYGPSNNSYPSPLSASSFVGYPGNPYGQLMRPTPGYLPEALSPYHHPHHHSGYPAQYGAPATPAYPGPAPPPNYSAYYNGYGPAGAIQNPANMPTYLSSHVLDHIHKNAAADSSVSFGGFC